MSTKKSIGIILLVVVFGIIIWKIAPKTTRVQAPTQSYSSNENSLQSAVKNSDGDFFYKREGSYTIVDATYPSKTSLLGDADGKARLAMENWIKERQAQFKSDYVDALTADEMTSIKDSGLKYEQSISYKKYSSLDLISYVYEIYEDTGGAHPNGYYMTFTFGPNGDRIELKDLFKTDARYLDKLSKISYNYLIKNLATRSGLALNEDQIDMLRVGTSPTPENIQFFYLDNGKLVLIFPPYQVAPYALGESEVVISPADLKDILK